jgi:hypothetical protein
MGLEIATLLQANEGLVAQSLWRRAEYFLTIISCSRRHIDHLRSSPHFATCNGPAAGAMQDPESDARTVPITTENAAALIEKQKPADAYIAGANKVQTCSTPLDATTENGTILEALDLQAISGPYATSRHPSGGFESR